MTDAPKLLRALRDSWQACQVARDWLATQPDLDPHRLWRECPDGNWMLWTWDRFATEPASELSFAIARDCALIALRPVFHCVDVDVVFPRWCDLATACVDGTRRDLERLVEALDAAPPFLPGLTHAVISLRSAAYNSGIGNAYRCACDVTNVGRSREEWELNGRHTADVVRRYQPELPEEFAWPTE